MNIPLRKAVNDHSDPSESTASVTWGDAHRHSRGRQCCWPSTGHTRLGIQRAWEILVGHGNGHHFVGLTGQSTFKRWSDSPWDYMLDHE